MKQCYKNHHLLYNINKHHWKEWQIYFFFPAVRSENFTIKLTCVIGEQYQTRTFLRSMLMVSGMVRVILYPLAAATYARAMLVLPDVGSTISIPGFNFPVFSASHIIAAPIRHFTEYAGFLPSIFASTVALAPSVTRLSLTRCPPCWLRIVFINSYHANLLIIARSYYNIRNIMLLLNIVRG